MLTTLCPSLPNMHMLTHRYACTHAHHYPKENRNSASVTQELFIEHLLCARHLYSNEQDGRAWLVLRKLTFQWAS